MQKPNHIFELIDNEIQQVDKIASLKETNAKYSVNDLIV